MSAQERAALSFAGLIGNIIESLECCELGRVCVRDVEQGKLRLDFLALRLSRWAASVGLSGDISSERARIWQGMAFHDQRGFEKIKNVLGDLNSALIDAKNTSSGYEDKNPALRDEIVEDPLSVDGDDVMGVNSGNNAIGKEIHRAVWDVCHRRKTSSLPKKAGKATRWALYHPQHLLFFESTVSDLVTQLNQSLLSACPTPERKELERRWRELVEAEVQVLGASQQDLKLLKQITDNKEDSIFSNAVVRRMQIMASDHSTRQQITYNHGNINGGVSGGSFTYNFGTSSTQ